MERKNRPPVVYLSGPITGVEHYAKAFDEAEAAAQALGCIVLNPTKLPAGLDYEDYMYLDFALIDKCDILLYLPGAANSPGAQREGLHARAWNKVIAADIDTLKEVLKTWN